MNKFLAIFCAILLFHNSCGIPVEHEEPATRACPFQPLINAISLAPPGPILNAALAAVQSFVSKNIASAMQPIQGVINNILDKTNQIMPSVIAKVNDIVANLNSTVTAAINSATAFTAAEAQQIVQIGYGTVTQILNALQVDMTQAIQSAISQALSKGQASISNIPGLAKDLTTQVLSALVAFKIPSSKALRILRDLQPAVDAGLCGLLNCTKQVIASSQSSAQSIVSQFETAATSFTQQIISCIGQTTADGVLSCLNNLQSQIPAVMTMANAVVNQTVQSVVDSFGKCADANGVNITKAFKGLVARIK